MGADVANALRGLQSVQRGIGDLGKAAAGVGATMTAGITAPLAAGLASAVSVAAEFEQTMNVLQAAAGATGEEMASLSGLAKDLGNDLSLPGTSASDAAEAMTELVKAGLSVTDTMGAAKGVLQLSAAAQVSNAEAAEITANALNAFALSGDQAVRVADLLAGAANASASDIGELASGMQAASAVFAQMNQPVEVLVNSMALLANAGIKGSDAGTSLKTMLLALGAPTKEAANLMRGLGVAVYDSNEQMRALPDIMVDLQAALAGLSEAEQTAALKTIFGNDAIRAAAVLSRQAGAGYDKVAEATGKAGLAALAAAAQTKGLIGAWEGLGNAVEGLALTVGEELLPPLTELVQLASGLLGRAGDIPAPWLAFGVALAAVLAAAGPVLLGLGALAAAFGSISAPVLVIVAAVGALAVAAGALAAAFGPQLLPLLQQFGVLLQSRVLPALQQLLPLFQQLAAEVGPRVQQVLVAVGAALATVLPPLQAALPQIVAALGPLGDAFGELWVAIQPLLPLLGAALVVAIGAAVAALAGLVTALAGALPGAIQVATGVVQVLAGTIQAFAAIVTGMVAIVQAVLAGDFAGAWEAAGTMVEGWSAGVAATLEGFANIAGGLFSALAGAITGYVSGFTTAATAFIRSFVDQGVADVERLKDLSLRSIGELVSDALSKIGELASELIAKFVEMGGEAVAEVGTWPGRMVAALGTLKDQMVEAGRSAGEGLVEGLKSMLGAVAAAAAELANAAANAVRSALQIGSPSRVFADIGRSIGQGVANGVRSEIPGVERAVRDMGAAATEAMELEIQKILAPEFAGKGPRSVTIPGLGTVTGSGFGFYKDLRDLAARNFAATGKLLPEEVWPMAAEELAKWGLSAVLAGAGDELKAASRGPTGSWGLYGPPSAGGNTPTGMTTLAAAVSAGVQDGLAAAGAAAATVVLNNTIANPLDASLVAQAAMDAIARG